MFKKTDKLFMSQLTRIIFTIIILYKLPIPLFAKIILLMTDSIDCGIPHKLFGKWIDCGFNSDIYQLSDKITDSICYIMLLFYILGNENFVSDYNNLIVCLLVFRLIGIYFFLTRNDRKYLFYFPNYFLEMCLGLSLIKHFPVLQKFKQTMFIIIIIYKIMLEYNLHVNRIL